MSTIFPVNATPVLLPAAEDDEKLVTSRGTVYYGPTNTVTAASNEGQLGSTPTRLRAPKWLVASPSATVFVHEVTHAEDTTNIHGIADTGLLAATGVTVDSQTGIDDDAKIEAAITAAGLISNKAQVVFSGRTYSIANFHRFNNGAIVPVGVPGVTTILATSAAAGIGVGPAIGNNPLNSGGAVYGGGFIFDGGGLATQGVTTNTVNFDYRDISVKSLADNADGFCTWGQNNNYHRIVSSATGTGFCFVLDNGAGGNRFYGYRVGGGNQFVIRQTVTGGGYNIPSDNVMDGGVFDQPNASGYGILQTAGTQNVFQNTTLVNRTAGALVKFEIPVFQPTGWDNGRLIFTGRNQLSGVDETGGQFAFWYDAVSGGVAGGPGTVGLVITGEMRVAAVAGDFKWGSTSPIISTAADFARFPAGTTRTFWTTDGTGALTAPSGLWLRTSGTKLGLNGWPVTDAFEVTGKFDVTASGATESLRSGASNLNSWLSLGRTAEELQFGVAGGNNNYFSGTTTGDHAMRAYAGKLHLGVEAGGQNPSGTAELVLGDGTLGAFGATPVAQQALGAAASDAATTQTLANNLRTALINLGLCKN